MNLTCPGCGFVAALEIFANDVDARHLAELMGKVPPEISDLVLRYLGLFAPVKHKMTISRSRRVLAELVPVIAARKIVRNRREWPAPIAAWDSALNHMLERRAQLTLPLRSHGYLFEVVVGLANQVEAQAEAKTEQQRRDGAVPVPAQSGRAEETAAQRIERMRREQEARDRAAPLVAADAQQGPDAASRRAAREAAEQELQQRRERRAAGDPRPLSDFIPETPQRGNP